MRVKGIRVVARQANGTIGDRGIKCKQCGQYFANAASFEQHRHSDVTFADWWECWREDQLSGQGWMITPAGWQKPS